MLLKLLKYDFRAMWKSFSLIWGAALALAVVNRFTITGRWSTSLVGENTSYAALFALFLVFAAMFVIASIFVIQRFSRGLLGDEGYLMHTLPVQPWQLVVSKLICALAVWIASGVVAVLSMLVMAPVNFLEMLQYPIWQALFRGILSGDSVADGAGLLHPLPGYVSGTPVPPVEGTGQRGRLHCPRYRRQPLRGRGERPVLLLPGASHRSLDGDPGGVPPRGALPGRDLLDFDPQAEPGVKTSPNTGGQQKTAQLLGAVPFLLLKVRCRESCTQMIMAMKM